MGSYPSRKEVTVQLLVAEFVAVVRNANVIDKNIVNLYLTLPSWKYKAYGFVSESHFLSVQGERFFCQSSANYRSYFIICAFPVGPFFPRSSISGSPVSFNGKQKLAKTASLLSLLVETDLGCKKMTFRSNPWTSLEKYGIPFCLERGKKLRQKEYYRINICIHSPVPWFYQKEKA